MNRREFVAGASVVAGGLVLGSTSVMAQNKVGSIAERRQHPGRSSYWTNRAAQRRIDHALDYSQGLFEYVRDADDVTQHESYLNAEELTRNIAAAQKRVGEAVKQAESAKDADSVKDLKSVSENLSAAAKQCDTCMEACRKESVDGAMVMECCKTVTTHLESAKKTYSRVMKRQHPGTSSAVKRPGK